MDGEGRVTLGAKAESNAGAVAEEQLSREWLSLVKGFNAALDC